MLWSCGGPTRTRTCRSRSFARGPRLHHRSPDPLDNGPRHRPLHCTRRPGPVPSPIARADVARFILDALRTREYVGKTVSLGKPEKGRYDRDLLGVAAAIRSAWGASRGTAGSARTLSIIQTTAGALRRPIRRMEVVMTHSVLRVSIAAAFVSSSPLSTVRADTAPTPSAPASAQSAAPNATPPSLGKGCRIRVKSGPDGATVARHPAVRHHARHYARHYAWRDGRRYASTVTTPWRPPRPAWPAAVGRSGLACRLSVLVASRTTAPLLCPCWPYRF